MSEQQQQTSDAIIWAVAIAVTAVLAGLFFAMPRMGHGRGVKAKRSATVGTLRGVSTAIEAFKTVVGRYPTTPEGLDALITKPASVPPAQWKGPYLNSMPRDSYGEYLKYSAGSTSRTRFTLLSSGPDRRAGSPDDISIP